VESFLLAPVMVFLSWKEFRSFEGFYAQSHFQYIQLKLTQDHYDSVFEQTNSFQNYLVS